MTKEQYLEKLKAERDRIAEISQLLEGNAALILEILEAQEPKSESINRLINQIRLGLKKD
jgi:hypothetical protein